MRTVANGGKALIVGLVFGSGLYLGCELEPGSVSTDGSDGATGGPVCTEIACNSSLTVTLGHQLDLSMGPHQIVIGVPDDEITCSIPTQDTGADSCFGFAFADVAWDTDTITFTMTEPFVINDQNPDGEPWTDMTFTVTRGMEPVAEFDVTLDLGDPMMPNGDDCPPTCYEATATATIP